MRAMGHAERQTANSWNSHLGRSHCPKNAGAQPGFPLPASGTYEVCLFSGDEQFGSFGYVGQVEFNRR